MGSKGSTKVEAPDPFEIARADAEFNRIDQVTPGGNLTFSGPNRNVATLDLSPELQGLFDSQTQSDQQLLNLALGRQDGFEEGLPQLAEGLGFSLDDFDRDDAESAVFDRGSNLLNRQFDRDEDLLRQSLANRGLTGAGTIELGEAANTELGLFNSGKSDAFENLALSSVMAGGQEQERQLNAAVGTELTDAGIVENNRARQFNELAALLGLQQTAQPGLNNFFAPGNADVTGAFGLNQQAQITNANNATSQRNALLSAVGGAAGAAIGLSDRRLKENIVQVGEMASGLGLYTYNFKGNDESRIGVMAQEALNVIPEAVIEREDGYLMVDYLRIH